MGSNETKPTILDIETLNAISARLRDRADSVHQFSLAELIEDLRIAARCADLLGHIRFEVSEIAAKCLDEDAARELRDLIEDAKRAEPVVGP